MDHPLPAPEALVRPWRTAAYVAGTVALVELLILLVIVGGALARAVSARVQLEARERALAPSSSPARPARVKPTATKIPAAELPRSRTTVLVLNGNGRTGAAAAAASRVRGRGYRIGRVGNASRNDFSRSIVMFKPGLAGEGHRLGRDLGVKMVVPLDGLRARQLGKAQLVFIIGA